MPQLRGTILPRHQIKEGEKSNNDKKQTPHMKQPTTKKKILFPGRTKKMNNLSSSFWNCPEGDQEMEVTTCIVSLPWLL